VFRKHAVGKLFLIEIAEAPVKHLNQVSASVTSSKFDYMKAI